MSYLVNKQTKFFVKSGRTPYVVNAVLTVNPIPKYN